MGRIFYIVGNKYFLLGFVLLYLFAVVFLADFGVIDDHTLVATLLSGSYIPLTHHIMVDIGRFYPLSGMDLNILSFLFLPSASVFYTFNALCIILIIFALRYILHTASCYVLDSMGVDISRASLSYIISFCIILLLITPSFIQSYLRLFVPERLEFLFLVLFFACYMYVYMDSIGRKSYIVLILGILFANASLYYKETAFAFLGSFGLCHLFICLFSRHTAINLRVIIFDVLLIISSCIWMLMYYLIVITHKKTTYIYGVDNTQEFKVISKAFFIFWKIFLNETFLIMSLFVGCGLLLFVWIKRRNINALFASVLIACFVFIGEYMVIGIYPANHYMLPCYVFGMPIICIWILFCFRFATCKWLFLACGLYFLLAMLPNSLLLFGHYKLVPINFQECVRFLGDYTAKRNHTKIYLKDINKKSGVEIYVSFNRWLRFYNGRDFDIDSLDESNPSKDDIIVAPYAYKASIARLLEDKNKYELLHASSYNVDVPNLSLRSLLRFIKSMAKGDDSKNVGQFSDYNFYIFKVLH